MFRNRAGPGPLAHLVGGGLPLLAVLEQAPVEAAPDGFFGQEALGISRQQIKDPPLQLTRHPERGRKPQRKLVNWPGPGPT